MLCGSFSQCRGLVCSLIEVYLVILKFLSNFDTIQWIQGKKPINERLLIGYSKLHFSKQCRPRSGCSTQFGSRSGRTLENVKYTHCCRLFRILYCVFIDKRCISKRRLFHAYHLSIKQFRSRPDPTFGLGQNCWQDVQQTTKT